MLVGKNIYPGERLNAIEIIENLYLTPSSHFKLMSLKREYIDRIKLAHRFKKKRGDLYQSPFPAQYFNPNNLKNGFRKTRSWYNQNIEYKRFKEISKKNKAKAKYLLNTDRKQNTDKKLRRTQTEFQKLQIVLKKYNSNPTMDNFHIQLTYMTNNMPTMVEAFLKQINTIH